VVHEGNRLSGSGVSGAFVRTVVFSDAALQIGGDTGIEAVICTAYDIDEIGHD